MDIRANNVEVFLDTERLCKSNQKLISTISASNRDQYIVKDEDAIDVKLHRFMEPAKVIVSTKRSLEAAASYKGKKVCVHNFASATNPSGGVTKGSNAQEEEFRKSTFILGDIRKREFKLCTVF